jgi:hypothetical protein
MIDMYQHSFYKNLQKFGHYLNIYIMFLTKIANKLYLEEFLYMNYHLFGHSFYKSVSLCTICF